MQAKGRIGVIMSEIIDPLNYELLDGIYTGAKSLGYDVILFTGIFNSQIEFQYDSYIEAMENIYELVCKASLDGIIYDADMFYNQKVKNRIYDILSMTDVPSIVMGESHDKYESVFIRQREITAEITKHLIRDHERKKLLFMAGYRGHRDSEERLSGFKDAMEECGLYFDDSHVFYGNFWTEEPKKLAMQIADGEVERPDAVVCANDIMAIAFVTALESHGIRVPEDISVTGFDGRWEAYMNTTQITTVCGTSYQQGVDAINRIAAIIGTDEAMNDGTYQKIRFGRSCGCETGDISKAQKNDVYLKKHIYNKLDRSFRQKCYMASNCITMLSKADSLEEFVVEADKRAHVLPDWKGIDICLCSDWLMDFENTDSYRRNGFPDRMKLALSKRYPKNNADGYDFNTRDILPCLNEAHEPQLWVLTSLHSTDQIFGYVGLMYDEVNDICFNESFINWTDALCNGISNIQRRLYQSYQHEQLERQSTHDPETGLYNKKGFMEQLGSMARKFADKGGKPFLLVISGLCREDEKERTGVDTMHIIANALRLSAGVEELYGRLENDVFCLLLGAKSQDDMGVCIENRILALERKIQFIQGNISGMSMPELVCDSSMIDVGQPETVNSIIDILIHSIRAKASAAEDSYMNYHELLQQLRREIYLNPHFDWSIAVILKRVGISRSHFQRIYKTQFGVTCLDDVIQARMEKAQQLLLYTDMRIQEISEQCGYNNVSHFMRQFKDKFDITASNYRKSNQ